MIDFNEAPGSFDSSVSSSSGSSGVFQGGGTQTMLTPPSFLKSLNDRQQEAVQTTEGPLIVLAGAGSGKTKMLTSRIAYLIEAKRVDPQQILAVTFTNKAAGEMRERVEKLLSHSNYFGYPEIGTFHSVCIRWLRRELQYTPFTKPFVIYDDSDQLSLVKRTMEKLKIDDQAYNPKAVQGAINRAKCDALLPDEMVVATHDLFGRQVKRIYEQYQKDLLINHALDFGEILCMAYRLLRDHPEVRSRFQRHYRYLHVDEYQDTNRAQYLLLSMLAKKANGGHENICVVGDEDQSIYGWRGADVHNILDFEQDYPGAHVVKLEQNYRSTKRIITAASHVIRNNKERKEKTLWTDNPEGEKITHVQLPDERAEAEFVIREIQKMAAQEGFAFGDFSVFYRTNAQSRQFEDVLRREKIPYQVLGGLRFYDRKEIKDILAYFKVVLNPSDSVSLKRIINVPARGIGKTTLEKIDEIQNQKPGSSYWDACVAVGSDPQLTNASTAKKIWGFVEMIDSWMRIQPQVLLTELYHQILDSTSYVRELRQEGSEESLSRIENLEEFNTILQEFEELHFDSLPETGDEAVRNERKAQLLSLFLEQTTLASDADQLNSGQSSVKLMTLHSSKGLEFSVVFICGMEEGLFPSIKEWEEETPSEIEEERRLCYVGMTRARQKLYLLQVVIRRFWGNIQYQQPSRFFREIPEPYLEYRNLSGMVRSEGAGSPLSIATGVKREKIENPLFYKKRDAGDEEDLIGRYLDHPEYGEGKVIFSEGSGENMKLTVEFSGRQRRKFLYRYVSNYLD